MSNWRDPNARDTVKSIEIKESIKPVDLTRNFTDGVVGGIYFVVDGEIKLAREYISIIEMRDDFQSIYGSTEVIDDDHLKGGARSREALLDLLNDKAGIEKQNVADGVEFSVKYNGKELTFKAPLHDTYAIMDAITDIDADNIGSETWDELHAIYRTVEEAKDDC